MKESLMFSERENQEPKAAGKRASEEMFLEMINENHSIDVL